MECLKSVKVVHWEDEIHWIRSIRTAVFIHEQRVPVELEWDEFDKVSLHVLAFSSNEQPVGTARLLPDGHIGRMAVLKEWRMKGIGGAMLQKLLEEMRNRGKQKAMLHAQVSAIDFYRRFGFQIIGEEFMEAGIPHVRMFFQL